MQLLQRLKMRKAKQMQLPLRLLSSKRMMLQQMRRSSQLKLRTSQISSVLL